MLMKSFEQGTCGFGTKPRIYIFIHPESLKLPQLEFIYRVRGMSISRILRFLITRESKLGLKSFNDLEVTTESDNAF